ncbi:MAG: adenylyl-sulfate kinase [Clostridiaceae bacterium]|nr:adenylyl-sulfate kinase [Clostridiaceae bacterium]
MKCNNITYHSGKVTEQDRFKVLGQKGVVVWLTGLSGSGKSTIAVEVEKILNSIGKAVYRLDGDNIRFGLNSDLGFTEEDRMENIRRISEVCALFQDAGLIVIASFISPMAKMRHMAREKSKGKFIEVYVKTNVETCIKRDPKGLYKKALVGEIKEFTGISAPYEEPENPDITLDTESSTLNECVEQLVKKILTVTTL